MDNIARHLNDKVDTLKKKISTYDYHIELSDILETLKDEDNVDIVKEPISLEKQNKHMESLIKEQKDHIRNLREYVNILELLLKIIPAPSDILADVDV